MTVSGSRRVRTIVVDGLRSKNLWLLIDEEYSNGRIKDLKKLIRAKLLKKKNRESKLTISLDDFAFANNEQVAIIKDDDVIKVTISNKKTKKTNKVKKSTGKGYLKDLNNMVKDIPFYDSFNNAYKAKKHKSYLNSTKSSNNLIVNDDDPVVVTKIENEGGLEHDVVSEESNRCIVGSNLTDQKSSNFNMQATNNKPALSGVGVLEEKLYKSEECSTQKVSNLKREKPSNVYLRDKSNLSVGVASTLSQLYSASSCTDFSSHACQNVNAPKHIIFSSSDDGEVTDSDMVSQFHKYDPCLVIPDVGSKLAFKVAELSEEYCPRISDFKVGTVKSRNNEERLLIELDEDYVKPPANLGKFGIPDDEDEPAETSYKDKIMLLKWDDIIEPKILNR